MRNVLRNKMQSVISKTTIFNGVTKTLFHASDRMLNKRYVKHWFIMQ